MVKQAPRKAKKPHIETIFKDFSVVCVWGGGKGGGECLLFPHLLQTLIYLIVLLLYIYTVYTQYTSPLSIQYFVTLWLYCGYTEPTEGIYNIIPHLAFRICSGFVQDCFCIISCHASLHMLYNLHNTMSSHYTGVQNGRKYTPRYATEISWNSIIIYLIGLPTLHNVNVYDFYQSFNFICELPYHCLVCSL